MQGTLVIEDLHVNVDNKPILKGVNLTVETGKIHAIMGPNGSGKSTLAQTIMGHPSYEITRGDIKLNGESILDLSPDKRSRKGLFLAFQYPSTVPGVSVANFMRTAYNAHQIPLDQAEGAPKPKPINPLQFRKILRQKMALLKMDESFAGRYLNEGFSGGEKKRAEMLQLAMLMPKIAILDETDSGLDIDALRTVAEGVNSVFTPEMGLLLITHYQRLLNYIKPDVVHVMVSGHIVKTGGRELALELEASGYEEYREEQLEPVVQEVH